ncbi:MAG: hypothetical protein PUF82_06540 [Lactobacillus equicursoris]|uniref:hypothetical protein n=1 Tax=Lactobacillus equicursoris TaxID=420645 RepID=UPI00242C653D|nr:hypothetical protein [Lactobacillus equicursoris]MDD6407630.1 hypothetical protein [Lactobacillus equicursoris]
MKGKILIMLAASLLLTGCSQSNKSTSSESAAGSSKVSQKSSSSKKASSKSSSVKKSASSSSTSKSRSSASSKASGWNQTTSNAARLSTFNSEIKKQLGSVLLPSVTGLASDSGYLNVRYSGNSSSYTVYYSVGYAAKTLNDPSLSGQTPYLVLTKRTYASASAAQAAVENVQSKSNLQGLPTTNLGSGITAWTDAGAGQRYVTFNEGNWQFTVHGAAVNGEDAEATAKNLVALLNSYYLPAPDKGKGTFEVSVADGETPQTLTWAKGSSLYKLQAHSTDTLIKTAASLK